MKLYAKHLIALAAFFALSCSQEISLADPHGSPAFTLNVTMQDFGSDDPDTKTSDAIDYTTTFVEGDEIGILAAGVHCGYRYSGGRWVHIPSTPTLPDVGTYRVYYPYFPTQNMALLNTYLDDFDIPSDQTDHMYYTQGDFMECAGTRNGSTITGTLAHRFALVELVLPANASSPILSASNGSYETDYYPWNISGQIYRCIVRPGNNLTLSGSYRVNSAVIKWQCTGVTLSPNMRKTITITNGYLGKITINYTTGLPDENLTLRAGGRIPSDPSRTIKDIVLTDAGNKTYLIGRRGNVYLNIDATGNLNFRPADAEGYIPIGSIDEFRLINKDAAARAGKYKQEADLDLLGTTVTPNVQWTPIGNGYSEKFTGTFDGNGRSIDNLYINNSEGDEGLFGIIANTGKVAKVHITNGNVRGAHYIGGMAGTNQGSITSCSYSGEIGGNSNIGGIAGYNQHSITACYNAGAVVGSSEVGGIAGTSMGAVITACYNTGTIIAIADNVGGITGVNDGNITACYNTNNISSLTRSAGGVAGASGGSVTACYWLDLPFDNATAGIASPWSNTGVTPLDNNNWPSTSTDQQWGTGDGSGDGKYWKTLGGWNGGSPVFPTLWWE